MVELAVTLGIVAVLSAIAVPSFAAYRNRVKIDQARKDIIMMAPVIARYQDDARAYPNSLADAGLGTPLDPWGRPYAYLPLDGGRNRGQARKDHSLVPINTDFDLYSRGPDGGSTPPLTSAISRDDIVRANNGAFVGVAADY